MMDRVRKLDRPMFGIVLLTGLIAVTIAAGSSRCDAVILYRSATRNTAAPTGDLANSGWQWEGTFGNFTGTPIAFGSPSGTSFFLTALHVGGGAGLTINGTFYPIDQTFGASGPGYTSSPNSDLRIWKVQGTIPTYASFYDTSVDGAPDGKELVVYGRGTQRGTAVYGRDPSPPRDGNGSAQQVHELKGWLWGASDHVQSWGTNYVNGVVNGGSGYGDLLYYNFDRTSDLPDESILSDGDSGGGVFIKSGSTWKLAGINLGVDGAFKTSADGPAFDGAIFDAGGMYVQTGATTYSYVTDGSDDVPAASYSTDVSSNLSWLHSVLDPYFPSSVETAIPEPASAAMLIGLTAIAMLRRRRWDWF